jgi:hypothetical protein
MTLFFSVEEFAENSAPNLIPTFLLCSATFIPTMFKNSVSTGTPPRVSDSYRLRAAVSAAKQSVST